MSFVNYLQKNELLSNYGVNHINDIKKRSSSIIDPRYRSAENILLLICAFKESKLVDYYNDYLGDKSYVSTSDYTKDPNLYKVLTLKEQLDYETIVLKIDTKLRKIILGTISQTDSNTIRARTIISKHFSSYQVEMKRVFEVPYLNWIKYGYSLTGQDYRPNELDIPVEDKLKTIFRIAVESGATDISFESQQEGTKVVFTIDKEWYDFDNVIFNKEETKEVTNWIITSSGIAQNQAQPDIVDAPLPTLGYIESHRGRVNKMKTYWGVVTNIRVLPNNSEFIELDKLNYSKHVHEFMKYLTKSRVGLVLIIGPTNSGKNTTSFSLITELLRRKKLKAISVEQPIEYLVPGVNQIQAETDEDYLKISRALVRQSPDIVYLSEIRDKRSIDTALDISNTGKYVISTLHVSRAYQLFYRASELSGGIDVSNKLTSELVGVVNQVLVPKACPNCITEISINDIDEEYRAILSDYDYGGILYDNTGVGSNGEACPVCEGKGTKGIVPIAEYIHFNQILKKKLRRVSTLAEKEDILAEYMESTENSFLDDGIRNMSMKKVNISTLIETSILDNEFGSRR